METLKMRRLSLMTPLAALALLFAAPQTGEAQTGLKIGYINSAALYDEAPGAQAAQQQFESEMERYRTEVQRLGEELQAMVAQYEQQQMTLSPEARQAREAAIREKDGAYRERISQLENEAGRRQQELVEPIMRRINDAIETLRREGNYSLIFDVGPGSNIIAADPALDLTNEVIRRLRSDNF
jgi:outer membrane protein